MSNTVNSFLIIEDEPITRMMYKGFLTELVPDCTIYEAENAAQGLCLYFEKKPLIVMLDMMMPMMSGEIFLDILEEGINLKLLSTTPKIIVITAIEDAKQLMDITKRFAVVAVIPKPLPYETLVELLEHHIK